MAIWDLALTATDVMALYKAQSRLFSNELSATWTPQWDSLVGYWKLDGNWLDTVRNVAPATINGDPGYSDNSKVGSHAGVFDGDDTLEISDHSSFYNSSGMTAMLWFKGLPQDGKCLFSQYDTSANERSWLITTSDSGNDPSINKLAVILTDVGTGGATTKNYMTQTSFMDNGWHHVAFTFSNNSLVIYVDGVQKSVTKILDGTVNSLYNSSANLVIGSLLASGVPIKEFTGSIDEVGLWSTPLSSLEISQIYERQKQKFVGIYEGVVFDGQDSSANWINTTWKTKLPYGKGLLGDMGIESTAEYSAIETSYTLSEGLIGLWKFNEESSGTVLSGAADLKDYSSISNHGIECTAATYGQSGKLGKAVEFNDTNNCFTVGSSSRYIQNASDPLSYSVWVYPHTINTTTIKDRLFSIHRSSIASSSLAFALGNTDKFQIYNHVGTTTTDSNQSIPLNEWTHLAVTYNGTCFQMYINGLPDGNCLANSTLAGGSFNAHIGSFDNVSDHFFDGKMDEMAVWNRGLSATEISQIYQRGANRIKMQIRSCNDSSCSGENWQGPDGTDQSWFSENNNCDLLIAATGACDFASGANLKTSGPVLTFSDFTNLNINDNRYFQYRVLMESDDPTASPNLPSISSVSVNPSHYYADSPSVTTLDGPIFTTWTGLSASINGGCSISYQASLDGSTWQYHNGTSWVTSSENAQSNSLSEINNYAQYFGKGSTGNKLYIKAILESDSTQSCTLNKLVSEIQYEN